MLQMLTLLAYANAIVLTKYSHLHRPTRTSKHIYCAHTQIKYIRSECKKGTEHELMRSACNVLSNHNELNSRILVVTTRFELVTSTMSR